MGSCRRCEVQTCGVRGPELDVLGNVSSIVITTDLTGLVCYSILLCADQHVNIFISRNAYQITGTGHTCTYEPCVTFSTALTEGIVCDLNLQDMTLIKLLLRHNYSRPSAERYPGWMFTVFFPCSFNGSQCHAWRHVRMLTAPGAAYVRAICLRGDGRCAVG